ncbi:hypothetical protein COX76_01395 [Candidatus Kaiserbacteria bacterium CG_4_10_14_0_2_um_filter_50_16]|nr:MAG: hypothetical protein COX76_01395 [Candidatus Kaiserbacteria bacterium CG_4_10_14_0_2_um_filter_50_16]
MGNFNRKLLVFLVIALLAITASPALASSNKVYGYTHISTGYINNVTGRIVGRKPAPSIEKNANILSAKAKKVLAQRRHVVVSRGTPRSCRDIIKRVGKLYWADEANLNALVWIANKESGCRPGAISKSGKYKGMFQLGSPPKWMGLGDAASETRAGCEYIKSRYGNPPAAKKHHLRFNWY